LIGKSFIEKIDYDRLCIGCGLCESISGKDVFEMQLKPDGFFHPSIKTFQKESQLIIKKVCPGINIVNDLHFNKSEIIWGKIEKIYSGYSTDIEIRQKGSSGGVVSALAIHMLENKIVDTILQVGGDKLDYVQNKLKMSRSKTEVLDCASSRYAPALIFNNFFEILNGITGNFCFIGKPCDISALKNILTIYPHYKNRFKLTIAIMCAGMPSFHGTQQIIKSFKAVPPIKNLFYRGNGWPGNLSFIDNGGQNFQMSYNDSWGKILGKYVHFRCKICPDGIGLQADIVVGDAWETKNGYPDFTEKEGQSIIACRTISGVKLIAQVEEKKEIIIKDLSIDNLKIMQPYQYLRRKTVGIRIFAFSLVKWRFLNFKRMGLFNNMLTLRPKIIAIQFIGTIKRLLMN
jgi:coenzyme F420 hydrogenase subunit beta